MRTPVTLTVCLALLLTTAIPATANPYGGGGSVGDNVWAGQTPLNSYCDDWRAEGGGEDASSSPRNHDRLCGTTGGGSGGTGGGGDGGEISPEQECAPSWRVQSRSTGWHPGSFQGRAEHWWGTRTVQVDGCGGVRIDNDRVCYATLCIAQTVNREIGRLHDAIDDDVPQIVTSPPDESLVNLATWFWHDTWTSYRATMQHPIAPTTVVMRYDPDGTQWDTGDHFWPRTRDIYCRREPEPYDPVLHGHLDDPDALCNSHRYLTPSFEPAPSGNLVFVLEATVDYQPSCQISNTPGPYQLPAACRRIHPGPTGQLELRVSELQSRLIPNP